MALDYSKGCVNFRNVGEWLHPASRFCPNGASSVATSPTLWSRPADSGSPGTIIDSRNGADPESKRFDADYRHFSISNVTDVPEL
jgi:hypothetical protein